MSLDAPTLPGPFQAYPEGSTVYVESYVRLRGSERVVHLVPRKVAKVGRKYLTTDDRVRWIRFGLDDTRLIREDASQAISPAFRDIRPALGCLLFRETTDIRLRLEREQEATRQARMNTALEDDLLCKIDPGHAEKDATSEEVAKRFVEHLIAKKRVTYVELSQVLTHKRGHLTPEEMRTILGR